MTQVEKQFDNATREKLTTMYEPKRLWKYHKLYITSFLNTSKNGYGQCSYIRFVNDKVQIHCCLLIGKSRVTPLNFKISILRLELTAAALSVKISKILREELEVHADDEIFWTDSQVVLAYINRDARRFKVFVANRVKQIRDQISTKQWHFIESGNNPADDASRGLDSKMKNQIKRCFNCPSFL